MPRSGFRLLGEAFRFMRGLPITSLASAYGNSPAALPSAGSFGEALAATRRKAKLQAMTSKMMPMSANETYKNTRARSGLLGGAGMPRAAATAVLKSCRARWICARVRALSSG